MPIVQAHNEFANKKQKTFMLKRIDFNLFFVKKAYVLILNFLFIAFYFEINILKYFVLQTITPIVKYYILQSSHPNLP